MTHASALTHRESPNNLCIPGRRFKISKWISFIYRLSALQTVAFSLVLRARESTCKLFKRCFSVPYNSSDLDMSPSGFQSQMFWKFTSLLQIPKAGVSLVEHFNPLLLWKKLWEKLWIWGILPNCGLLGQDLNCGNDMSLPLLLISVWPFHHLW